MLGFVGIGGRKNGKIACINSRWNEGDTEAFHESDYDGACITHRRPAGAVSPSRRSFYKPTPIRGGNRKVAKMEVMKITVDYDKREKASQWLREHFGGKSYETWFESSPYRDFKHNALTDFYISMDIKKYLVFFKCKFSDYQNDVVDVTYELRQECDVIYIDDVLHLTGGPAASNDEVKYFRKMQPLIFDRMVDISERIKAAADLWVAFPKNCEDANIIAKCFREIISKNAVDGVDIDRLIGRLKLKIHHFFHVKNPIKLIWQIGWQLTDNGIFDWAHSLHIMMHVVNLVRPFQISGGIGYRIEEYQQKTGRLSSPKMPGHLRSRLPEQSV